MIAVPYDSLSTEVTTDYEEHQPHQRAAAGLLDRLVGTVHAGRHRPARRLHLGCFQRDAALPADRGDLRDAVRGAGAQGGDPLPRAGTDPAERARLSLAGVLRPLKHEPFRKLLGLYLCQALTMDVVSALIVYYSLYVVRLNVTVFLGIFIVVNLVGFLVVGRLVKTVSKNVIYRTLIPLALVGAIGIGTYPGSWPTWGAYGSDCWWRSGSAARC